MKKKGLEEVFATNEKKRGVAVIAFDYDAGWGTSDNSPLYVIADILQNALKKINSNVIQNVTVNSETTLSYSHKSRVTLRKIAKELNKL